MNEMWSLRWICGAAMGIRYRKSINRIGKSSASNKENTRITSLHSMERPPM